MTIVDPTPNEAGTAPGRGAAWGGIVFAIIFPTVVTWAYFYQAADADRGVQQVVMAALKGMQFAFPILWVAFALREKIDLRLRSPNGALTGLIFGLVVAIAGGFVFHFALENSPAFIAATEKIRAKVTGFGIDSATQFIFLGVFYSLVHSLLEEYYWRWFVFGQLRQLVALWPAIIISAVGFMAHHVLVLSLYFGWWTWPTLLLSAAVAIGGAFWAWLYDRSGSLLGPWLSHLVIDAAIFSVGFHLVRDAFG